MLKLLLGDALRRGSLSKTPIRDICQKSAPAVSHPTPTGEALKTHKVLHDDTQVVAPNQIEFIVSHKTCVEHVKRYDRENYLAALSINDKLLRRTVFALRAFNVELALVRDMTTNSDRAKLRFHFWSKLIDEIIRRNEEPLVDMARDIAYYRHTPIAKELLDLFRMVDVDEDLRRYLKDLVGARVSSKVLGYKPFEHMRELELYCSKSNSSIYHLAWRINMQTNNVWDLEDHLCQKLEVISNDLGVAQGLSNIIRGILYNSTKNCCYIPQDLLDKYQLTNRDFVNKKLDGEKIKPAVQSLANRCQELVTRVYREHSEITKYYRQLFLPRVAIQAHLNKLKKCNYNICDPRVNKRNELLPLSMKLASIYFRAPIL